jgi:uncharacterized DUF497 family protein
MPVDVEFDPNKNEKNIEKHGISLKRARDFVLIQVLEDTRKNYGERRWQGWGTIDGKPHMLAFTVVQLSKGGERVRAISLRPATEREIKNYALQKKKRS